MPDISNNNKEAVDVLIQTLQENPDLWEVRKKTAKLLFADHRYPEAADMVWNAPNIPSTDVDVAFALRIISRVKPNRSIRLIYEILKRNKDKPLKNMAVARALNKEGLFMEAARFYGVALAEDPALFDLSFESQMLWMDDSGRLIEEWENSAQPAKPPLDVAQQDISGGAIDPASLRGQLGKPTPAPAAEGVQAVPPARALPGGLAAKPPITSAGASPGTRPLMMNPAATPQTSPLMTNPTGSMAPVGAAAVPAAQVVAPAVSVPAPIPVAPAQRTMAPDTAPLTAAQGVNNNLAAAGTGLPALRRATAPATGVSLAMPPGGQEQSAATPPLPAPPAQPGVPPASLHAPRGAQPTLPPVSPGQPQPPVPSPAAESPTRPKLNLG